MPVGYARVWTRNQKPALQTEVVKAWTGKVFDAKRDRLEMLTARTIAVEEIARQMGVHLSTLYRHILGGQSAIPAGGSL